MPKGIKGFQKGHPLYTLSYYGIGNKIERYKLECDYCHKIFEMMPCDVRTDLRLKNKHKFCSHYCSSKYYSILNPPPSRKGFRKYPNMSDKDLKKYARKVYKKRYRNAGKMDINVIQRIYEENIKLYGSLTCFYCLKNIVFGQDSIDHKIPLIKGGTHIYENLIIACRSCNSKKGDKTDIEFRKVLSYGI